MKTIKDLEDLSKAREGELIGIRGSEVLQGVLVSKKKNIVYLIKKVEKIGKRGEREEREEGIVEYMVPPEDGVFGSDRENHSNKYFATNIDTQHPIYEEYESMLDHALQPQEAGR